MQSIELLQGQLQVGLLHARKAQFEPLLETAGKSIDDFELIAWADLRVDADRETAAHNYLNSVMGKFAANYRKVDDDTVIRTNWVGSVEQIAEQIGVTRLAVQQTESRALRKLVRRYGPTLREFLDELHERE